MLKCQIVVYGADEKVLLNGHAEAAPLLLATEAVHRLERSGHETHFIFTSSKGQVSVGLASRRRLNEIGARALFDELLAFLTA